MSVTSSTSTTQNVHADAHASSFPQKKARPNSPQRQIPNLVYLFDMIRRSNGKAALGHNKYLAVGTQLPHKKTLTARHSSASGQYVCLAHAHTHGSPTPLEVRALDERSRYRCQKGPQPQPLHTHLSRSRCKSLYAQLETVTCANLRTYAQPFVRVRCCQSVRVCMQATIWKFIYSYSYLFEI